MADEQTEATTDSRAEPSGSMPLVYDTNIPDVYSNNSEIILGDSDVSVLFMQNLDIEGRTRKGLVRVAMTHANFMSFVSYCNTRAKLLETAYGGRPTTLLSSSEQDANIRKAIDDMLAGKRVEAKFEFVEKENNDE